MKVAPNKCIRVSYELHSLQDGKEELVEKTSREQPFKFITGIGYTLDAFEKELLALNKGDKFEFTIPYQDAYGEYNPQHRQNLKREIFEIDGKLDEKYVYDGNVIEMLDGDRNPILGTVIHVGDDTVIMDFNHPLAGCDLLFTGEIIDTHEASKEEMKEMLDSMQGGCGGCCSCGDDDCHSDDCGCSCGHCH